jgi:hypothetical protein
MLLQNLITVALWDLEGSDDGPVRRIEQGFNLRFAAAFDHVDSDERVTSLSDEGAYHASWSRSSPRIGRLL